MITIGHNPDHSGVIHTRKHPPTGTPENTARTYYVNGCQVRYVDRVGGKVVYDGLTTWMQTEQEAEAVARELADPSLARDRGKRVLEELLEDGE